METELSGAPTPSPTPAPVSQPPDPPPDLNLLAEEARQILAEMLPLLSLDVRMTSSHDNNNVRIQMKCEDAALLIGRRGSTINELQFLVNRIMQRRHKIVPRFFLDVDAGPKPQAQPQPQEQPKAAQPMPPQESRHQPPQRRQVAQHQQQQRRDQWEPAAPTPKPAPAIAEAPPTLVATDPFEDRMKAAANKVRRWGEPLDLGPMSAEERQSVQDYFARDREIEAVVVETKHGPQIRLQSKQQ